MKKILYICTMLMVLSSCVDHRQAPILPEPNSSLCNKWIYQVEPIVYQLVSVNHDALTTGTYDLGPLNGYSFTECRLTLSDGLLSGTTFECFQYDEALIRAKATDLHVRLDTVNQYHVKVGFDSGTLDIQVDNLKDNVTVDYHYIFRDSTIYCTNSANLR